MPYNQEPNNNDSAGSFSAKQTQQLNRLNEVAGNGIVPLVDNRERKISSTSGKAYLKKYRKDDTGKYIKNVSAASMQQSINETTSDKYDRINMSIIKSKQRQAKLDRQRKQKWNPYNG